MDRRTFLSAASVSLLSSSCPSWAATDENAAPYYEKACLLLPGLADPMKSFEAYEAENQLLDRLPAAPVNALGLDLLKRSEPALREMLQGASLKNCDWGIDFFVKFIETQTTISVMKVSRLAQISCLRACYSFQKKNSPAALSDLAATVKMARHLGRRGPFMARLVQIAIENRVIDVAAAYLPQQKDKDLTALTAVFESLSEVAALSEAMEGEKAFLLQCIRPKYEGKNWKEVLAMLRKDESEEEVKAIVKASGGDVKGMFKLIDGAAVLYDELGRIWDLPPGEFKAALSAFRQKHAHDNPFATSILPAYEGIRFASDRTKARFAMLHAAAAVVSGGAGELKSFKDPFGEGPFEYRPFGGGFELKSKLQGRDRLPVFVTVGRRAKD